MTSSKNSLREFLTPANIIAKLDVPTKKNVLQSLADHVSTSVGKDPHEVFDALWEREKLGTTGVGNGIAIPHARMQSLTKVQGLFAKLTQPVAFDSIDDKPVDLVFLLLAPQEAGADHLNALAAVSKLLREPKLVEQLRRTSDATALYKLLTETALSQAA